MRNIAIQNVFDAPPDIVYYKKHCNPISQRGFGFGLFGESTGNSVFAIYIRRRSFDLNIARFIDHTNLKPEAAEKDIVKLCMEATEWSFYSVCVNSLYAAAASRLLKGTAVKVCSVVGFPLGACISDVKACEAELAANNGASEIDMVISVGALKDGKDDFVREDIASVVRVVPGCVVKVILETALLTDGEKKKGCLLAMEAGAHFAKTSTGFSVGGATVTDVELMRGAVGTGFGVKASGGIRDFNTATAMIEAGASRLGTSSSVAICQEGLYRK